ncbi:TolC family protein [Olivibacter sitiensis]|uniref:TolC family protein n=1 Tax=Olivibacter sitiensis TaxID=376470 RepID=UPI00040504AE|nr:TolC family protein [Olivibacter sitiensis]
MSTKWYYLLILASILPLPSFGQQLLAPSASELVDSALVHSHRLAIHEIDIAATATDIAKTKDIYLPNASIAGKYGFMAGNLNLSLPATTLPLANIAIPEINTGLTNTANLVNAGLDLSAVLYTGGKAPALRKATQYKQDAQRALSEKEKQEVISTVSKAYDQLALLKQVKNVLDESKKRLEINTKTADKALSYGLITKYEHQKIAVATAQLEAKTQEYEGQRNLLLQQLHLLTDIHLERLSLIDKELLPYGNPNASDQIDNRPELKALSAAIEAHKFQLKAANTWWIPKVQAGASVAYVNLFDIRMQGKDALPLVGKPSIHANKFELAPMVNVGVGLKWDIFDGNKGRRETQLAKLELSKAEHERQEAEELLQLNLIKSNTDFDNSNNEIKTKYAQLQVVENALQQANKEFKVGLIKSADLIGAETDFQAASLSYIQAIFDQRRHAVELLKATGDLTPQSIQE